MKNWFINIVKKIFTFNINNIVNYETNVILQKINSMELKPGEHILVKVPVGLPQSYYEMVIKQLNTLVLNTNNYVLMFTDEVDISKLKTSSIEDKKIGE